MENRGVLTRTLAVAGTVFAWFPIVMPVFFSAMLLAEEGELMFDYLMPAEIFPIVLAGAALLIWAAFRARQRRAWIGWSFVVMLAALLGAVGLAQATGLASGETGPAGWPFFFVNALFVIFWAGLIALALGGALLWRDLAHRDKAGSAPSPGNG